MRFGSLFSGIGGMDLGLERTGMECAWQVEIDDYCTRVLEKHWPNVPRHRDIKEVDPDDLEPVELIAGGFPCQDLSYAGKGAGIEGERSGLWSEYFRLLCHLRPRYVLVENVPGLLTRGMGRVLKDLWTLGYDAEWEKLPAAAFGAPHLRYRVFIVAYPNAYSWRQYGGTESYHQASARQQASFRNDANGLCEDVAHANGFGCRDKPEGRMALPVFSSGCTPQGFSWSPEPAIRRVANGVPYRVDRLRGLGNAVVPQVAEWVGERILEHAL